MCNSVASGMFAMLCRLSPLPSSRTFHHPKRRPRPHEQSLPVPFPQPWQLLICFLFLCPCLFGTYMDGITDYMAFRVWPLLPSMVFSWFIHITAGVRDLFLFATE